MTQDIKCLVGLHKFEVYKEEEIKLAGTDLIVGKGIICRCTNCGKIKTEVVNTTSLNY